MRMKFYTPHILLQEYINCIMVVHVEVDSQSERLTDKQLISFLVVAADKTVFDVIEKWNTN